MQLRNFFVSNPSFSVFQHKQAQKTTGVNATESLKNVLE